MPGSPSRDGRTHDRRNGDLPTRDRHHPAGRRTDGNRGITALITSNGKSGTLTADTDFAEWDFECSPTNRLQRPSGHRRDLRLLPCRPRRNHRWGNQADRCAQAGGRSDRTLIAGRSCPKRTRSTDARIHFKPLPPHAGVLHHALDDGHAGPGGCPRGPGRPRRSLRGLLDAGLSLPAPGGSRRRPEPRTDPGLLRAILAGGGHREGRSRQGPLPLLPARAPSSISSPTSAATQGREKRGGDAIVESIDSGGTETSPGLQVADPGAATGDAWFDRHWALAVMERGSTACARLVRTVGQVRAVRGPQAMADGRPGRTHPGRRRRATRA